MKKNDLIHSLISMGVAIFILVIMSILKQFITIPDFIAGFITCNFYWIAYVTLKYEYPKTKD